MPKREAVSGEAQALSRKARKKSQQRQHNRGLGYWLRASLYALLALSFSILALTALFLSGLNSEGITGSSPKKGENVNILIMGIDAGLLDGGGTMVGRSDVLILLSLDTETRNAMLLSIPRDTWVDLPDIGEAKINAAHVYGGVPQTLSTVAELLEQPIHYFIKLDFAGFQAIVDAAGGVILDVEKEMYYYDPYDIPPLEIDLQPGVQRLGGNEAMQYVRYRDYVGDIGRVERQKNFLLALAKQLGNPLNYWRLPGVARQAQQYLATNLTTNDILRYAMAYITLAEEPVLETLPGEGSYGGMYWLPHYAEIKSLFQNKEIEPPPESSWFNFGQLFHRTPQPTKEEIRLIVLNGNGGQGSATRAAEDFQKEHYQIIDIGDADSYDYTKSVIIYNHDAEAKAKLLQSSIPGAVLQAAEKDSASCDLVVIIGVNYLR